MKYFQYLLLLLTTPVEINVKVPTRAEFALFTYFIFNLDKAVLEKVGIKMISENSSMH